MRKIKWKILLIVAWLLSTLILLSLSLRAVSLADTTLNVVGVLGFTLWVLLSIATNCFTFKYKKNEKKD